VLPDTVFGAILEPRVKNERLFAYAEPWNWNDLLVMFRTWYPDRQFVDDMELGRDIAKVANGRALELLRLVYNQEKWTSLEDSVKANVASFMESGAKPAGAIVKNFS
jgi:hypothetical protein